MIGNDVVDLAFAKKTSRWQRPGFQEKVFTTLERQMIAAAPQSDEMAWLLWSMKEAAYKLFVRQLKRRFFAPAKLICTPRKNNVGTWGGEVRYEDHCCATHSIVEGSVVHTVAHHTNKPPESHLFKIDASTGFHQQRTEVYQLVIQWFSDYTGYSASRLSIRKKEWGIPYFYLDDQLTNIPLSLSHHGNYAGMVFHYGIFPA